MDVEFNNAYLTMLINSIIVSVIVILKVKFLTTENDDKPNIKYTKKGCSLLIILLFCWQGFAILVTKRGIVSDLLSPYGYGFTPYEVNLFKFPEQNDNPESQQPPTNQIPAKPSAKKPQKSNQKQAKELKKPVSKKQQSQTNKSKPNNAANAQTKKQAAKPQPEPSNQNAEAQAAREAEEQLRRFNEQLKNHSKK